jgi:hypothetical protein
MSSASIHVWTESSHQQQAAFLPSVYFPLAHGMVLLDGQGSGVSSPLSCSVSLESSLA